jgi:hypothetical protein
MSYEKEGKEVCEAIRMIVSLDVPPNITPEQAVSDFMTALFEKKDAEILALQNRIHEMLSCSRCEHNEGA